MSPDNLFKDPTLVPVLFGMATKIKDFAATKGLVVAATLIFTSGGMYYQFNSLTGQIKELSDQVRISNDKISELNTKIITTNGRIDVVATNVENMKETISQWMRLYGPKRLEP